MQAPDFHETVEGWRAWGVPVTPPPFGVAPKLTSVTTMGSADRRTAPVWEPRKAAEAVCPKNGSHEPPHEPCSCGFYSAKSLDHLMSMTYHVYDADGRGMFRVIGQVANWGKVIEGSKGWRAQFSYPVQLFVPFEAWRLVKPLSEAYGVPVRLQNILNITTTEED